MFLAVTSENKKNAAVQIFGLLWMVSLIFFGTSMLFNTKVLSILTQRTSIPFFNWFAWSQIFILPTYVAENILTVDNQPKKIILFGLLSYLAPTFVFLLPIWLGLPLETSYIFLFGYAVFRFLYVVIFVLDEGQWTKDDALKISSILFDKKILPAFILLTVPMLGYFFLNQFSTVFINGLVLAFAPDKPEIFAQFRYGAREFPLVLALVTGLSNSYVAALGSGQSTLEDLKMKSVQTAHIIFPISILLLLTSKYLFPIVFNPAFAASVPIFNIYVLLVISRALFPQTVLLSMKKTNVLLYASIAETLFIVVSSTILLKNFGIVGVAWSVVIGFLLEKIILAVVLGRNYKIPIWHYTLMKIYLGYCVLVVAAYLISQ